MSLAHTYCAATDCSNNSKNCEGTGISFHRFPANQGLRRKWITKCRLGKVNPKASRLCSNHFNNNDFQRDLKNELLGLPLTRKLKPEAIPTIFQSRPLKPPNQARVERSGQRERKQMVAELLASSYEQGMIKNKIWPFSIVNDFV